MSNILKTATENTGSDAGSTTTITLRVADVKILTKRG